MTINTTHDENSWFLATYYPWKTFVLLFLCRYEICFSKTYRLLKVIIFICVLRVDQTISLTRRPVLVGLQSATVSKRR